MRRLQMMSQRPIFVLFGKTSTCGMNSIYSLNRSRQIVRHTSMTAHLSCFDDILKIASLVRRRYQRVIDYIKKNCVETEKNVR